MSTPQFKRISPVPLQAHLALPPFGVFTVPLPGVPNTAEFVKHADLQVTLHVVNEGAATRFYTLHFRPKVREKDGDFLYELARITGAD